MTVVPHGSPEFLAYLSLMSAPEVGHQTLRVLLNHFRTLTHALEQHPSLLSKIIGKEKAEALRLVNTPKQINTTHSIAEVLFTKSIQLLSFCSANQSEQFCAITPKPAFLFAHGNTDLLSKDRLRIAVVGTRRPTRYGISVTQDFSRTLAQAGCVIVSGLAFGIDTAAHSACVSADGATIAVLGSGILNVQPRTQTHLHSRILEANGLVISESPPLAHAQPGGYVLRNRIIAGISSATLVVEGTSRSGALITARCAAEQGSEVFCIPSLITSPNSEAPHILIKNGAHLVQSPQDILTMFQHDLPQNPSLSAKARLKQKIISHLKEPKSLNLLTDELSIPRVNLAELMIELEIEGTITQIHNNLYTQRARIDV